MENVINFDFPPTPDSYVHRVGRYVYHHCSHEKNTVTCTETHDNIRPPPTHRTARGVECGTALTFVCPIEEKLLNAVEIRLSTEKGDLDY